MKPSLALRRFLLASTLLAATHSAHAQTTYYWDPNTTDSGFGTAGGTWGSNAFWTTDGTGAFGVTGITSPTTSDALNFGNGATGLAAGTVTVSGTVNANSLTFASGSGAIILSGGTINLGGTTPTITANNASNTISSIISGSAGLAKEGTGTLILSGANSYTGTTAINGGMLQIGDGVSETAGTIGNNSSASIGANGTLSINRKSGAAGNAYIYTGTLSGTGTVRSESGARMDFDAAQTSSGNLDFVVNGSLNARAGSAREIHLGSISGSGNISRGGTAGSGVGVNTWVIGGKGMDSNFSGNISSTDNQIRKVGAGKLTLSGTLSCFAATIDRGTLEIATTSNPSLTGGLTLGSAATITTPGILDLTSASATFGGAMGVNFNSATAGEIKIGSTRTLTINNNVQIGATTPAVASTVTKLNMTGGGTFNVATAAGGTFIVGGSTSTTNAQDTTLDLTALKATTINASATGTLRVNPSHSTNLIGNKATLLLPTPVLADTVATATITAGTIAVGDLGSYNNGTGQINTLQLGTGLTTLNASTINVGTGLRDLGQIIFGQAGGDLKIRAANGTSRATALNVGAAGGNTAVTSATLKTLVDFSGHDADILVTSLNVGNQNRRSNLTYEFNFGQGDNSLASQLDATNVNIGFRTGTSTTTSILTSRVNLSGGTVIFGDAGGAGTGVDIGNSTYDQAGVASTVGELNISGGNVTIHNSTSMSGAVRLGTNIATGSGTVTASLNITGGTTTLGGHIIRNTTSPRTTSTVLISGGTLDMGGNNIGTSSLPITLTAESGTLKNVGTINGTGGLTKTTEGTLTLSGTNTYTGATTVSAGTLLVNGSLGNRAVTVDGGAFGGSGTIGATLNLTSGSFSVVDLFDALQVTGTVTLYAGFGVDNLVGLDWENVSAGTYTLINGNLDTGVFASLDHNSFGTAYTDVGSGKSAYFQEGSLQLVVIPEPRAALLGGLGLLLLLRRRRQ